MGSAPLPWSVCLVSPGGATTRPRGAGVPGPYPEAGGPERGHLLRGNLEGSRLHSCEGFRQGGGWKQGQGSDTGGRNPELKADSRLRAAELSSLTQPLQYVARSANTSTGTNLTATRHVAPRCTTSTQLLST